MADAAIFDRLKQDHDKHRTMLDLIEKTHGDSDGRRELFERFRVEVTGHATAEEESLYAVMLANPELNEDGRHSVSEHKEIDDMISELFEMDMSSPGWLTRFRTMKKEYLHHIKEEEDEIFPHAAKELSGQQEAEIKSVFEKRKPAEKQNAAKDKTPGDDRD